MTDERIEKRLQLHIMNLCLAATAGKEGDLREAKGMLVREVARIVHDATNPHVKDR
jgi:hypothetical protein